jgi:hypothetical protein
VDGQSDSVGGVDVRVNGTENTDRSDNDGHFDLGALPADVVDLQVTMPSGAMSSYNEIDLSGSAAAHLDLRIDDSEIVALSMTSCDRQEARNRFEFDVDDDGQLEDGHIRARRDDGRERLQVEVGPLEVSAVRFLISEDDDPANEVFSAIVAVRANGDAELELEVNQLPESLDDLAGHHVFVDVLQNDDFFDLGTVPGLPESPSGCNEDNDVRVDTDGDEQEIRTRFDVDVTGDGVLEDGHIRIATRRGPRSPSGPGRSSRRGLCHHRDQRHRRPEQCSLLARHSDARNGRRRTRARPERIAAIARRFGG